MVRHLSADELKEQYQRDLDVLQKVCPHKKTHWCEEWNAPARSTGWMVLYCKNCWKIIKRKGKCSRCGKTINIKEEDYIKLKYDNPIRQHLCSDKCYKEFFSDVIG
jgi:hypothetical protein